MAKTKVNQQTCMVCCAFKIILSLSLLHNFVDVLLLKHVLDVSSSGVIAISDQPIRSNIFSREYLNNINVYN